MTTKIGLFNLFPSGVERLPRLLLTFTLSTLLFMTGCAMTPYPATTTELVKIDSEVGKGTVAATGNTTRVHYTGWLFVPGASGAPGTKGKKFDSSLDRNEPFEFTIGQGRVIKGWEQGVAGMAVGGKRTLIIPPELAYGSRSVGGGLIPPNSILLFEIELLAVR
jgi:FKBP-type peptidyl-prolyl cis-trans isomerase